MVIILNEKTMIRDLTTGSPMRQLLAFSYPFILSNILQQAYNMADMIIVGQFVGSAGLAAASSAGELAVLFLFLCMGFSNAGQIIISQHIGAGNKNRIGNTIGNMFTFLFLLGIILTIIPVIGCDTFLRWLNVPEESFDYARDYALVCFCGMVPVCGYNAVGSILRGMGDSKHPFIFIAIASVLNIVLDLIFVGPLGMACFGAALATVISQSLSFVLSIVFLYRRREEFGFDFKLRSFALRRNEVSAMLKMGLPLSLQLAAISGSMLIINSFINVLGVVAAAATAVGNKITVVANIISGAMNTAGSSIVAQNFAAGKINRVSKTLGCILIICISFCTFLGLMLVLFPEQIFSIFDKNPEVIAYGHVFAPIGFVSLLGFATRPAAMALINGIGNSRLAFICGIVDGIIARIGLSVLFGMFTDMGVAGYWLGSALAGHSFGLIALVYYLSGKWKKRKLLVT